MYYLYETKFHAVHLDVNGTDIAQPVEVAEVFEKLSICLPVYLLTYSSFSLPVGYHSGLLSSYFCAVAYNFLIRHFESHKPQTLSVCRSGRCTRLLFLTIASQYLHRCLNIFSILVCHRNTFQHNGKKR